MGENKGVNIVVIVIAIIVFVVAVGIIASSKKKLDDAKDIPEKIERKETNVIPEKEKTEEFKMTMSDDKTRFTNSVNQLSKYLGTSLRESGKEEVFNSLKGDLKCFSYKSCFKTLFQSGNYIQYYSNDSGSSVSKFVFVITDSDYEKKINSFLESVYSSLSDGSTITDLTKSLEDNKCFEKGSCSFSNHSISVTYITSGNVYYVEVYPKNGAVVNTVS